MRLIVTIFALFAASMAAAQDRVALVLGNDAYAHTAPLENAVGDAQALGAALERLGFEVILRKNVTADGMRSAIRDFSAALEQAELALFFYAGHGIQLNGRNYLIPTDSSIEREADVDLGTIPLDVIVAQMDRSAATRVVLLDACRNNPFETRLSRSLGQSRSASALGRGLAPIETNGGTFVGFATDPGEVAYDGGGAHSPFTQALLNHIEAPGVEINTMMTRVRAEVFEATESQQRPWSSSSLLREVYLVPDAPAEPEPTPQLRELSAWETIAKSTDPDDYARHLAEFPDGLFSDLAQARLARLQEDKAPAQETPVQETPAQETPEAKETPAPEIVAALQRPRARPLPLRDAVETPVVAGPQIAVPAVPPQETSCDVCPPTVRVAGGPMVLGDRAGTPAERPEVRQEIAPFHIAASEISVGDLRRYEAATGRQIPRGCWVWTQEGKMRTSRAAYWGAPGYAVDDGSPAACLNWDDASAYVSWLSDNDPDHKWRLPSEAEFEFAARAGTDTAYPWAGGAEAACDHVNGADAGSRFRWRNTRCDDGVGEIANVGAFPANGFGLYHMIGNLWEWTEDCWNANHAGARSDGAARLGGTCGSRVLRGGSWDDPVENLRSAYRVGIPRDRRQGNVGFRPVKVAE